MQRKIRCILASTMLKKIPVSQLTLGMYLHALDEKWLNHSVWRSRFLIADSASLQKIQQCGVEQCWIDVAQGSDVASAPPEPAAQPAQAASAPAEISRPRTSLAEELQRAAQIRTQATKLTRHLFAEVRLGNAIQSESCASLVSDVVDSIDRNRDALCSLVRLKTADEYTYVHSVAVCALMVSLARQLGMDDAQCREAGLAGLLHDLGKAVMPQEILNKPGKLTDEEFDIIKTHPVRGHELLLSGGGRAPEVAADVCLHHHERIDGKGYPHGLTQEQITVFSRMGAICDVYDAVTSDRPYKSGWDPAQALAQMASWQGHFDAAILQSFIKCIGIYPTGSLLKLRSGRLAVVVEQNMKMLTRPRVKVFFSTKSGLPLRPQIVDLAASDAWDQIEGRESPEKWRFSYLNELWGADAALAEARR